MFYKVLRNKCYWLFFRNSVFWDFIFIIYFEVFVLFFLNISNMFLTFSFYNICWCYLQWKIHSRMKYADISVPIVLRSYGISLLFMVSLPMICWAHEKLLRDNHKNVGWKESNLLGASLTPPVVQRSHGCFPKSSGMVVAK